MERKIEVAKRSEVVSLVLAWFLGLHALALLGPSNPYAFLFWAFRFLR